LTTTFTLSAAHGAFRAAKQGRADMKEQPYKYMVRLPPNMRDLIRESARHYRRSMNSDIVARLQQSFSGIPDASAVRDIEPPLHQQFENVFRKDLTEEEIQLIRGYRRLSSKKRQALHNLLV
jgi:hypothetical protein